MSMGQTGTSRGVLLDIRMVIPRIYFARLQSVVWTEDPSLHAGVSRSMRNNRLWTPLKKFLPIRLRSVRAFSSNLIVALELNFHLLPRPSFRLS